jgi:hypothetical protein
VFPSQVSRCASAKDRFLGNHVDRHDNEEARNLPKYRSVNYSQIYAAYAKDDSSTAYASPVARP